MDSFTEVNNQDCSKSVTSDDVHYLKYFNIFNKIFVPIGIFTRVITQGEYFNDECDISPNFYVSEKNNNSSSETESHSLFGKSNDSRQDECVRILIEPDFQWSDGETHYITIPEEQSVF